MLDLLYSIFIAPIEIGMLAALNWGYSLTNSSVSAIIVMSLVVNIAVLPIYMKAEEWQDEERKIRKGFELKEKMIKSTFKGQERFVMLSTMHRQANYTPILQLRSSVGFLLQIPFFFAAYHLLSNFSAFEYETFYGLFKLSAPDGLLHIGSFPVNVLPILMTLINLLSAVIYTKNLTRKDKIQLYSMAGLFLVLLYDAVSGLVLYWICNNIFSLVKNFIIDLYKKHLIKTEKNHTNPKFFSFFKKFESVNFCYWPSCLLLSSLVFIYFPLNLYLSDPKALGVNFFEVLEIQLSLFILALIGCFWLWIALSKLKCILSSVALYLALSSVIFSFVITPDYGVMDAFVLQNPQPLNDKTYRILDIFVGILLILGLVVVIKFQKAILIKKILVVLTIAISVVPFIKFLSIDSNTEEKIVIENTNTIPTYVEKFLTFSKDGNNILVIMLDAFTGGHMKEILERNPEIKNQLSGFVWYPDTVTSGSFTILGKASILGGENAHPLMLNKIKGISLEEKINDAWSVNLNQLQEKNYEIAIYDQIWLKPELLQKRLKEPALLINSSRFWNNFPKFWSERNNFGNTEASSFERFFTIYGLFKISPISVRKKLYTKGNWRNTIDKANWGRNHSLSWFSELDSFHLVSKTESTKNTFKFLTNETTHGPWHLNTKCMPTNKGHGDGASYLDKKTLIYEAHYQTELCALKSLIKWFDWMKAQEIYDNTQIILVSDHGRWDSSELKKQWKDYPVALHGLLLVKNFNANGTLEIVNSQLANWDVPVLIKNQINQDKSYPWLDPKRERCHVIGQWQRQRHPYDQYKFTEIICIAGSLFNKESWKSQKIE